MNGWVWAATGGGAVLLASLAWAAALLVVAMRLGNRARALASHPTLTSATKISDAVSRLATVSTRLDAVRAEAADVAADIAVILAALVRARLLLREISTAMRRLFASVSS
jgi:hypothetical protein